MEHPAFSGLPRRRRPRAPRPPRRWAKSLATCSGPASSRPRSRWRTRSPMSRPPASPTCTISRPRSPRPWVSRRALHSDQRAVPARLGSERRRIRSSSPGSQSRPGLFPIFEAENGYVTSVRKIACPTPVTEYLMLQRRFAHLFRDGRVDPRVASAAGDRRPTHQGLWARGGGGVEMKHPYAIALDVGTSKLNLTGSWRTQRPIYVDRLPPCNAACPAVRGHPGLAQSRGGGRIPEAAWRALTQDNPLPAVMGRVLLPSLRKPPATALRSTKRSGSANSVERFSGDVAIDAGWTFDKPKTETGKRGARGRRWSGGPLGRLSPAPSRPWRDDP